MAKKAVVQKKAVAKAKVVTKKPAAKKVVAKTAKPVAKKVVAKNKAAAKPAVKKAVKPVVKKAVAKAVKPAAKKVVKKAARPAAVKAETPVIEIITIETLPSSGILLDFIGKYDGQWDHNAWLELCEELASRGISSADFDRVGLLLEEMKAEFFRNK